MFKKVEIWVLYATLLVGVLVTIGFGFLVRQELVGGTKFGWLSQGALFIAEMPSTLKSAATQGDPLQLPDVSPGVSGFAGTPLDYEAYMLLSRFDGDTRESVVELIDLRDFRVLHSWNPDFTEFFTPIDGSSAPFMHLLRDDHDNRAEIRHPLLMNDGGLLIHAEHTPLLKIDACSNLLWMNAEQSFHHAVELDDENHIWVSTSVYPYLVSTDKVSPDTPGFMDDAITKLDADGNILFTKSVSNILLANDLEHLVFPIRDGYTYPFKDPIHMNDIQPVYTSGEFFERGDLLLSLKHQSMVLLYRPSTDELIWHDAGKFNNQHDVDIWGDGLISIYDNNLKRYADGLKVDGSNRVLLYDFDTNEYKSLLESALADAKVATVTQGLSERLKDGSLFVVNSNFGQSLLFNADGTVQWRHVNRGSDGSVYYIGWHRILFEERDLENVRNFLTDLECSNAQ